MESANPCLVKLETFEGPLDLLLHLIKKNEVDIYDIPVSMITDQYLEYIDLMKELNLETAGDYLVIASELGFIKSRMLLPKPEPELDDAEEDPRAELVRKLLEFQRYKEAAQEMLSLPILGRDVFVRTGFVPEELDPSSQFLDADLWSLIDALQDIYRKRDYSWPENIEFDLGAVTLDEKIYEVINTVRTRRSVLFESFFRAESTRFDVVITFLAVLELVKNGVIRVLQDSSYSSIYIVHLGDGTRWNEIM